MSELLRTIAPLLQYFGVALGITIVAGAFVAFSPKEQTQLRYYCAECMQLHRGGGAKAARRGAAIPPPGAPNPLCSHCGKPLRGESR